MTTPIVAKAIRFVHDNSNAAPAVNASPVCVFIYSSFQKPITNKQKR